MLFKRLSPRTLFSLTPSSTPSPYSIFIAKCSSSPTPPTYSHSYSHPESRNARVSVWWDLEKCNVPSGGNVFKGAQSITAAIESSGIKGPIQITAFGDMVRLARTNQKALSSTAINSTGIKLTHTPRDEKDNAHRFLCTDLMLWVNQNPPPAHIFLITGDVTFSPLLHQLRLQNYNILLASKEPVHFVLKMAATIMWNWDALVRDENLNGRYFNQPPDDSWYGHYEGPIEDPVTAIDRPALYRESKLHDHELSQELSQDSFWTDVQTFINTKLGSMIIAESRTRENMGYYFQEYGPSVLKSVTNTEVLEMIDMLIEKKKWVIESPDLSIPFKLTSSAGITCDAQGSESGDSSSLTIGVCNADGPQERG